MDSSPTPPRRQSDRRSTPRHHNRDEGYGSPPDRSRLAGEFALARRGGTATTPFSVADSSPSPGDAAGGGGGTPEPEGGSAANKGGQRAGERAKKKPNDEGSTRLCWTPAEKVVLWKAIQRHNPFAESGQKLMRKHWCRVATSVIEDQDVDIYTNEGGRETIHVSMKEKTKNLPFDTLVSRCKQLFDDNRRSKEKAEKDSEGKTGEGEKDAEVFDEENEEGSEDCELLKAMACREAGMASKKKGTGPSKEHMAQGLALRDSARDGPPGRGATQGLPVAQPAGGRGKGSSSTSKSRYSAAAAANNRSRGEDCRFRRESEASDGEVSPLSLETATGKDEEEEEELSDEPDAWDQDRKATLLASGKAVRGTRSGKGGGKRTRSVPPLSSTISGSAGLLDRLSSVIDLVSQKMTPQAVPTGGGGEQGGVSSSTGSDEIKDLLKRSIERQEQMNQQIFNAIGMMHGGVQPHPYGMQAGAGALPPFGRYAGFGGSAAAAGLALPAAVGVPPPAQSSQGATAAGATALPVVAGGGQAARVGDASSAGGGGRLPSFGASSGGRATGATSAVAAGGAVRVSAPRKASPATSGQTLCECGLPASHGEVKSGANKGRKYVTCPKFDRNQMCNFHIFLDPAAPMPHVQDEGKAAEPLARKKARPGHTAPTISSTQRQAQRQPQGRKR